MDLNTDIPTYLAEAERRVRANGLTIQQICRRARIDSSSWRRWRAGKNPPSLTALRRLDAEINKLPQLRLVGPDSEDVA